MLHIPVYNYFKHCDRIHFSPASKIRIKQFCVVQALTYFCYFEYKISFGNTISKFNGKTT